MVRPTTKKNLNWTESSIQWQCTTFAYQDFLAVWIPNDTFCISLGI